MHSAPFNRVYRFNFIYPLCQLPIVNRRCQLIGYYCLRQFWERTEQDENRLADAGLAQFNTLFHRSNSEHLSDFVQCLRYANRAVSVSIRLDNSDETSAGSRFDCRCVRHNRRQVYFYPRPGKCRHGIYDTTDGVFLFNRLAQSLRFPMNCSRSGDRELQMPRTGIQVSDEPYPDRFLSDRDICPYNRRTKPEN